MMVFVLTTMNTAHTSFFNRRQALWAASVLALAGAFAAGAQSSATNAKLAIEVKRNEEPVNRGTLETGSFSSVVKRVAPSVVKITTTTKARKVAGGPPAFPGFEHPAFRQFFGGAGPQVEPPPQSGLGSGVIISSDGFIVTNNHVIEGADEVIVAMNDQREFKARVIGRDPQTDIAVIKVEANDLPAITFADSGKIEVGDRVLAIGNPFGIGETVTTGIVSAKGRRAGLGLDYEDFVQTDAAINPGNSGGALVDVEGRLIGINTAILSRSGGFQGVGLAVPANLVGQVADGLVRNGKVIRGYLGVGAQDLTPTLAESLGLKTRRGALVADVQPGSPAAKAGVKNGDVIIAVNGEEVEDANRLTFSIGALAPGTSLELRVLRDGVSETVEVTIAERAGAVAKAGRKGAREREAWAESDEGVLNGVAVEDVSPQMRNQFNVPARLQGALITQVAPNSAAAKSGLRAGDLILEINRQVVKSAQDAVDLSRTAGGKKTLVRVYARGATQFVVVDETKATGDASE